MAKSYKGKTKKELIASLRIRDTQNARLQKQLAEAQIVREEIPTVIDEFLRAVMTEFSAKLDGEVAACIASFFDLDPRDAARIAESLRVWAETPLPGLESDERDAIRKEHFALNRQIERQDVTIQRLIIERNRARKKLNEMNGLFRSYRTILGDILTDPETIAPSLASTLTEELKVGVETGAREPTVFSDEALEERGHPRSDRKFPD